MTHFDPDYPVPLKFCTCRPIAMWRRLENKGFECLECKAYTWRKPYGTWGYLTPDEAKLLDFLPEGHDA